MAFNSLTEQEISTGEPVTTIVFNKVKDNLDDHESRLGIVEGGGAVTYPAMILRVGGYYGDIPSYTGVLENTVSFDIQITGARLIVTDAGTANTTEIDVQIKNPSSSFQSIFATRPSLSYSAGSHATSSNQVLDNTNTLLHAGGILRLDIIGSQTNGRGFTVRIDYYKAN